MRARKKLLGTDQSRPWKERDATEGVAPPRPRVLVEEPDGAEAFALWRLLEDDGYDVSWCQGPEGRPRRQCALVTAGSCELVENADVVVSSLGLSEERCRDVLEAVRRLHPETPLVVEASRPSIERWAPLFEGNWVLHTPVTAQTLRDSVRRVLADRAGEATGEPA
jgi:DNA-binding NtrC family response regulator